MGFAVLGLALILFVVGVCLLVSLGGFLYDVKMDKYDR